ncbi:MAG: response regulator transcription factor [Actinobacteria bacterium]|nr:response regulator transcription factor [Actinomycetota bacterium]
MTVRVLIADDQALMRSGLRMVLEECEGIEVAGEAIDGSDAVRQAAAQRPDVVLMDVRMPVLDGVEATRRIVAADPDAGVLVITTFDLDEHAFAALHAGASGFLLKDVPVDELVRAIRAVASGDAVVSPRITRRLLELHAAALPVPGASPAEGGPLGALTPREREVLVAVAEGLSNAEIADRLVVSEATVKTHVGAVLAKLGLRGRVQAVIYAYDHGLVAPAPPQP